MTSAQIAGNLDTGFNPASGPNATVNAFLTQPDGKVIISGPFTQVGTVARQYLARLNADGSLDASFTSGITYPSAPYLPWTLALQNDGKVLVVDSTSFRRLNADGSADTTFSANLSSPPMAVVPQPDGKILVGGSFSQVGGKAAPNLARLTSTGARDTTFAVPGSGINGQVNTVALQSDGKVVIGGSFTGINGTARTRVARLNADGTLDTTFNPGSGADATVSLIRLQADGKMIVSGNFSQFAGVSTHTIVRLNANGSLDTSFAYDGGAGGIAATLAVQTDGKVVLGGSLYADGGDTQLAAYRLNTDGSKDATFNAVIDTATGGTIALQADGKVLLGGGFTTVNGVPRFHLARFNADGTLDGAYGTGTNLNGAVNSVALAGDGKIIVGGAFTLVGGGKARNHVARLLADGTVDSAFDPGSGADGTVNAVAVHADGRVLLAGAFTSANGVARPGLARLKADGTLDGTFAAVSGLSSGNVTALVVQPDGKVILTGTFTQVNGTARNGVARLNTDGSLDAGFDPGTGANAAVKTVAVQADGKVILGGTFTQFNGVSRAQIVRLNADGSLDAGFLGTSPTVKTNSAAPPTVYGVTGVAVQADGKIWLCGDFTAVDGVAWGALARLNPDGSLDASFNPGSLDTYSYYTALATQPDGKVVVAGKFSTIYTAKNVARYNADGSADNGFVTNQGVVSPLCLALQPDGKVIVGGDFASENGTTLYDLARVYGDGSPLLPVVYPLYTDGTTQGTAFLAQATLNARGTAATAWFQYGTTTDYGASTPAQSFGSNANTTLQATVSGLQLATLYHYRPVASNHNGTVYGQDMTTTTLTVAADWRRRHFGSSDNSGNAADAADPDGDGISNLLERALGLDPAVPLVAGLPMLSVDAATHRLVLTATRGGADAADLVFAAEASADLVTWTTSNLTVLTNTPTSYQVRDDGPTMPRRFLRLRVTQP